MSLETSTVHRNLDAKMKIMGLEAPDLLSVLIFAALMNLFFGKTTFAPILVFILPALALVVLYIGKKNKPDDYLIHLARYLFTSGQYSAGNNGELEEVRKEKIYEFINK